MRASLLVAASLLFSVSTVCAQTSNLPAGTATSEQTDASTQGAGNTIGYVAIARLLAEAKKSGESESDFLARANKAVNAVATVNRLDMVLQVAVYVDPRIDITDDLIAVLKGESAKSRDPSNAIFAPSRIAFVDERRVLQAARARAWTQEGQIEAATEVIKEIAIRNGIAIVVHKAVFASLRIDLTPQVVAALEK